MAERKYGPEIIDRICEQLEEGKSLAAICRQDGMPAKRTVYNWIDEDEELGPRLLQAREIGFLCRAEQAVEDAKNASDPHAGRLAFDAERWYLGKLSNAFRDKPLLGVQVNVGNGDAFDTFAQQLAEARSAAASRAGSTSQVAGPSSSGSDHPTRQLADLASPRRQGVGEDEDRG